MALRLHRQIATLAVAVVAGACAPDAVLAPAEVRVSLDDALAELAIPALLTANAAFTGIGLVPPTIVHSECTFDASSESFVCPPIPASGAVLARSFTLVSAAGARQSVFDRGSTSWIRANSTVAGTIVRTGSTDTVDGQQELTLAGLLTDRHTINGTSTTRLATVTDSDASGQPVVGTVTTKLTDVVLLADPPDGRAVWPLSGRMEVQTSIDTDYPPPLPAPGPIVSRVIVLFSGTSIVDVAITIRGVTHVCAADLASTGVGCAY